MDLLEIAGDEAGPARGDDSRDTVDVSFFVPCYNEADNVLGTISKLVEVAKALGLSYEILVFDDCSKDATVEVVRNHQRQHPELPLRLFVNTANRGVARNFVEGGFRGRGRYYRMVCGDDVEPIESLKAILELAGQADIVIPYHTRVMGRPLYRRLISRFYTYLVNLASGRHLHYYNGLPLYLRRDVMRFHVEATGLGYQAEFLLRLLQEDRSYVEVPLVASDRGESTALSLRNFVSVAYSIFKITAKRVRSRLYG